MIGWKIYLILQLQKWHLIVRFKKRFWKSTTIRIIVLFAQIYFRHEKRYGAKEFCIEKALKYFKSVTMIINVPDQQIKAIVLLDHFWLGDIFSMNSISVTRKNILSADAKL